jgi:hypothetical protein
MRRLMACCSASPSRSCVADCTVASTLAERADAHLQRQQTRQPREGLGLAREAARHGQRHRVEQQLADPQGRRRQERLQQAEQADQRGLARVGGPHQRQRRAQVAKVYAPAGVRDRVERHRRAIVRAVAAAAAVGDDEAGVPGVTPRGDPRDRRSGSRTPPRTP